MPGRFAISDEAVLPFARGQLKLAPRGPLGPALKAAREAMRLSLNELSNATRISVPYLAALEEGRYDAFAGMIYATGFTRAYAREVGVPEDWALKVLREEVTQARPEWRRSGWVT
ncbi:helix-turn-helix domain-containing protein [Sphingomonas sp. AOB5]|uniref:helix-turn-helix domain-containing protein n=1 Tax=Sphingomonas sp. AOB5 TaxID=3034017 RepID=UPI0023FA09C4|nr:helix-turn-helix domain-containing protein [Sphingomonas sp. AOB5]MDF7774646.1 helix-turn-helix domain-containing protein [Sphingomonas sp. AOB5]